MSTEGAGDKSSSQPQVLHDVDVDGVQDHHRTYKCVRKTGIAGSKLSSGQAICKEGDQIQTTSAAPFSPGTSRPNPEEAHQLRDIVHVPSGSWPKQIAGRPCIDV
jgi:hypothetical protein